MDEKTATAAAAQSAAESGITFGSLGVVQLVLIALLALAVIAAVIAVARLRARAARDLRDAATRGEQAALAEPPVAPMPPPLADTLVPAAPPPEPRPVPPVSDEVESSPVSVTEPERLPDPIAAEAPAPAAGDDLTRMKGVGPKLAARLGELGYTRFAQIAALGPDEATTLDAQLGSFQGRLARDRWIEQARFLAAGDTAGFEGVFGKL